MIKAFESEKPDKLLLLGDVLYHGPRNDLPKDYNPKAVINLLNPIKEKILCVRGNCDSEVDQMVLDFNVLCEQAHIYVNDRHLVLAHGHKLDEKNIPALRDGDYLVCGVKDCKPDFNDIKVVNGEVFAKTYSMIGLSKERG